MGWALFWMLYGSFQALGSALGVFLIQIDGFGCRLMGLDVVRGVSYPLKTVADLRTDARFLRLLQIARVTWNFYPFRYFSFMEHRKLS